MTETRQAPFDTLAAQLAGPPHLAVLTTLLPDGHPQSHVVWVGHEPGRLLVNTERHRAKYRNVLRDSRVTVLLVDGHDPHRFLEVRGAVTDVVGGAAARQHADRLSHAYRGRGYPSESIRTERVVLVIEPLRCLAAQGPSLRTLDAGPRGQGEWSPPRPE
ncbi:PPOX class F420-dependent oxidoreductase [Streptomyces sp. NPDC054796]